MDFKELGLEDIEWMRAIAKKENSRSADFNFVSNYLWSGAFNHMVAKVGGRMVIKVKLKSGIYYSFPVGDGDLKTAIQEIRQDATANGIPMMLCGALQNHIDDLHAIGINNFRVEPMTAANDYIYEVDALADLKGKKLHGKRNHINKFIQENEWHYEPLTIDKAQQCKEMLHLWMDDYEDVTDSLREDANAVCKALDHYELLGLIGGILYVDDEIAAFTIGDIISDDTVEVNFEKAHRTIQGAYPMINREFVRMVREQYPQIRYINREDDMGNEGLRKAKRSYYPVFMIEKNNLIFDNEEIV